MDKSNEIFDVPKCPSCSKPHKYSVAVLRSSYMFGVSDTDAPSEKRFRRLFTCPNTETDFEGFVVVKDDPKNKIVSIVVEGLIKEEE